MTQDEAQQQITSILAELERATGRHVAGIYIEPAPRFLSIGLPDPPPARWVQIDLRPTPGTDWAT